MLVNTQAILEFVGLHTGNMKPVCWLTGKHFSRTGDALVFVDCHTEIEAPARTCYVPQAKCTGTGGSCASSDPVVPVVCVPVSGSELTQHPRLSQHRRPVATALGRDEERRRT